MTLVNAETGEKVDLWLDQAIGHHVDGDLNVDEARIVTAKIKGHASMAWLLLQSAHERKAYRALGYDKWGDYVEREFDMSRSRSYQLLDQAKVIREIGDAVSTTVDISEREARDIAPVLNEAIDAARDAVESLPEGATDDDRSEAVETAVKTVRETTREAKTETAKQRHDDLQSSSSTTWADVITTYPAAAGVPRSEREGLRRAYVQLQTMSGAEKVKREAAFLNSIDTALLTPDQLQERRENPTEVRSLRCPKCNRPYSQETP